MENLSQTCSTRFSKNQKRKPEKLWTEKSREFYNKHVKELGVELYSTENEEKSSVAERWNRMMKEKMFKYCTANNTNKYIVMVAVRTCMVVACSSID